MMELKWMDFNIGLRFAEDKPRDSGGRGFDGGRGRGRGGRGGER